MAAEMKALQQEGQKLKRNARTHHLCNLGSMLEGYLKEPDLLEEDDVKYVLDAMFQEEGVQRALDRMLEQRRTGITASEETEEITVVEEED